MAFRDGTVLTAADLNDLLAQWTAGAVSALGSGLILSGGTLAATGGAASTFVFTQSSPASTWTIAHNLNRFPAIDVIDSAGNMVEGDVVYTSANTIIVTFGGAFSGVAYLN